MCGVAGAVGRGWSRAALDAMVRRQSHRGPDAQGIYEDPAGLAGLGHDRLSIIDLSPAGRQPMASPDLRYWIVLNGEIYNYLELRSEPARLSVPDTDRHGSDPRGVRAVGSRVSRPLRRHVRVRDLGRARRRRSLRRARPVRRQASLYSRGPGRRLALRERDQGAARAGVPAVPDEETWADYLASGSRTTRSGPSGSACGAPAGHALERRAARRGSPAGTAWPSAWTARGTRARNRWSRTSTERSSRKA